MLGGGSTAGAGGDGAGGEEAAWGSRVRLALNPQKSAYLEKCSIRLLISPFALISLLVCAAAVLLSGREGEAEEGGRGGGREACAEMLQLPKPNFSFPLGTPLATRLAGLQAMSPSEEGRLSSSLAHCFRAGGEVGEKESNPQSLLSPVQLCSCQSLLRCLQLSVRPKPRAEAKGQNREG